jgi:hypothetical protein
MKRWSGSSLVILIICEGTSRTVPDLAQDYQDLGATFNGFSLT